MTSTAKSSRRLHVRRGEYGLIRMARTALSRYRNVWLFLVAWTAFRIVLLLSSDLHLPGRSTVFNRLEFHHFLRKPKFPSHCTRQDYDIIRYQLPEEDCVNNPSPNQCSTSYATRCPDPFWLQDEYFSKERAASSTALTNNGDGNTRRIAISVGCNKGADAVNTLRLISGWNRYDVDVWYDTFVRGRKVSPGPCAKRRIHVDKWQSDTETHSNAVIYCIEAMPITSARLLETATALGWQDHFIVTNIAIANSDDVALFPNIQHEIGIEYLGFGDCYLNGTLKHPCIEVPVSRLDTFAGKFLNSGHSVIEFLSIDAEGYDFEVLLGATKSLRRTKYLEFEYHEVGVWPQYSLSTTLSMLKDMNFVCYWAGSYGHLWRITDCWMDYFQRHGWSNVACVNIGIPGTETLAARMEDDFQKTLDLQHRIRYAVEYGNPFEATL
jgi:FkbM family methyltransferase